MSPGLVCFTQEVKTNYCRGNSIASETILALWAAALYCAHTDAYCKPLLENSQTPSLLPACRSLSNMNDTFQRCSSFTTCTGDMFPHSQDPCQPCLHRPIYSSNPSELSVHFPASSVHSLAQALPLRAALTASADGEGLNPLQEQEPYLTH